MTDRTVSVTLQARVSDYITKFSAAGKATEDFAAKVDLAKGRAAEGYASIGHGMLVAGGLVGLGVAGAVKEMADFTSRLAQVQALSHASSAEMRQLHDAALTAGMAYGFSATQVADAEIELTKAGVSVADILGGALHGALVLAAAGQMDVAEATTVAASAMVQFGLQGKDVPHIADLLAAGADKALGSVGDLGYGLAQVGPVAHQFDISIEETIGTLSALANAGQIGERGGTELSQMLLKLSAPGKNASNIMQQLGISVYDTSGKFVGLSTFAGELHDKLGNLTQAERTHDLSVIFGSRAIKAANVLYQEGAQGIDDWTDKVNTSGFAALQAAGKMNSLSGDVQKFKAALQDAFIGAGENANGPLRSLVQDASDVVNAWNRLPAPLKTSIELFTVAGGVALFVGGAFITLVPKINAARMAMQEMGGSALTARSALGTLSKVGAVAGTLFGFYEMMKQLEDEANKSTVSVSQFSLTLSRLNSGDPAGVTDLIHQIAAAMVLGGHSADVARIQFANLDQALSDLVTRGRLDIAQTDFNRISDILHKFGYTTDQITQMFPQFSDALASSASSAQDAGNGLDQFGNHVNAAGKAMQSAMEKAKAYSDAIKSLTDPLFGMSSALSDLKSKQAAASKALAEYGPHAKQTKQANLDLAQSAIAAEGAAHALSGAVKDGTVSVSDARTYLEAWVKAGILTKAQADSITGSFGNLIGKARTLAGFDAHVTVTANTAGASRQLSAIESQLLGLHDKTVTVKTINTSQHLTNGSGGHLLLTRAYGGWVGGNGGPRQDDQLLNASTGEFVVNAASARANGALLEAINSGARIDAMTSRGGATGGDTRPSVSVEVTNHYPEPEKASEATPRAMRDALYLTGAGWQ